MNMRRLFLKQLTGAVLGTNAVLFSLASVAQTKLLKFLVPLTPGTTPDTIARAIGPLVSEKLDMSFLVDNRAGASSMIGMSFVAKSNDSNLLLVIPATTVTLPLLYKSIDFDVINGFTPITQVASSSFVLVIHPSVDVKSLNEFVTWTKANKNLFYASPGVGTHHHLSMELLKQITGAQLEHIPYKGSSQAFNDFLGGQVPCMFMPIQVAVPLEKSGKLKIIGGTLKSRHPDFPEIPSLSELGAKDFQVDPWFSIWGPPKMSSGMVDTYRNAILSSLQDPIIKESFKKQGLIIKTSTPAELLSLTKAESKLWTKVIYLANIQPE
jgi:tripartite-type tricarboxylate transporter receptor subunit TctC